MKTDRTNALNHFFIVESDECKAAKPAGIFFISFEVDIQYFSLAEFFTQASEIFFHIFLCGRACQPTDKNLSCPRLSFALGNRPFWFNFPVIQLVIFHFQTIVNSLSVIERDKSESTRRPIFAFTHNNTVYDVPPR